MSTMYNVVLGRLEAWIVKNSSWLALGIVVAAFAIRVVYADSCYLNADEAIHFQLARQSSWPQAYEASKRALHPPLFVLVLHGILFLGRTELFLRLPSLIGGTAALWLTFAWMRRILGAIPALAGLVFMTVSPAAISAATEVRQYGLLLFFVCGSLYATERALSERSTVWTVIQGFFLFAALLTHYTAIIVIASLALYTVVRSILERMPRSIFFTVCASYAVLAAAVVWLYFKNVRLSIQYVSRDYLRIYYWAEGRETPLGFVWRALSGTFAYACGARRLAFLFMFIFLVGLAALLKDRSRVRRLTALLVISPFAMGFVAGVFQVFPFAGSRHQTYLLPFFVSGISAALVWLQPRLAALLFLIGVIVIAPIWVTYSAPDNNGRILAKGDMTAAIEFVDRTVPRGAPLFADYETLYVLKYYLARDDTNQGALRSEKEERLGGYRIVTPREWVWAFRPNEVLDQVNESAQAIGVRPGDPLWVISTAWTEPSLASRLASGQNREFREFGRISVIKIITWNQSQITLEPITPK